VITTIFKEKTMSEVYAQHGTGGAIGVEAASHVDRHSESYCTSERQRIETVNRPAIFALRAQIAHLQDEAQFIEGRINHAAPPGTLTARKRKARFRYAIAAILTVAAWTFSVIALEPYQLGWKAWLYCLGIAIVTLFLVDRILDRWASPRLVNLVTTVAGIAAIVSLILLAEIRGDLMGEQVSNAPTAVIDDADAPPPPPAENTFYDRTVGLLRFAMAFLAFAIEIGAGIALHEAGQLLSDSGEDVTTLRRELTAVRECMIAHGHEVLALENAGAAFEHEFWRDFYRSLLNGVKRGALQKIIVAALALGVLAHGQSPAADRTDLAILLDLSQSVATNGQGSKAEFEKNVAGVTNILSALPVGTKVTVIGITEDSFATPYVVFSAAMAKDEGYFKERLAKGHAALMHAWQERSARLAPSCASTDIMGALLVASEVFQGVPKGHRKMMIILSDMRQATHTVNLEHVSVVETSATMERVVDNGLLADLRDVDVYAEGVDGAGESVAYWQSLHDFWKTYFASARATLVRYSPLRDVPEFERARPTGAGSREK
jgi:hypothetical protein